MEDVLYLGLLLVLGACTRGVNSNSLDGYKLVSAVAHTDRQAEFLLQLQSNWTQVDFWSGPALYHPSTMLVCPDVRQVVESALTREGIPWQEINADVNQIVEGGMALNPVHHRTPRVARSTDDEDVIDHTNYHSYNKMVWYLRQLEVKYPGNLALTNLSYLTHEGRDIAVIKIHSNRNVSKKKPSIVIESGIHAREWISSAATLYVIEKLLQSYHRGGGVTKAQSMLDSYDWYIIPMANPDGYEYTRSGGMFERMWRKNRRLINWECVGVDLNRNFDAQFGTTGVSKNCWSFIYPGESAFSEPETASIREFVQTIKDSIVSYVGLHSYSQFLLQPWGYSNAGLQPTHSKELERVAKSMVKAIKNTHGKTYKVGTVWSLLKYAASGSSMDWALSIKQNLYAFTYELRPDEDDPRGFNLPPDEIVPTGQELLASLEQLALGMKPVV